MKRLHQIIYTCEQARPLDQDDLIELSADAMGRNAEHHITGVIVYCDGYFLQLIEGYRHELNHLMRSIRHDNRARNIEILSDAGIQVRDYPDSFMSLHILSESMLREGEYWSGIFHSDLSLPIKDRASLAKLYLKTINQ